MKLIIFTLLLLSPRAFCEYQALFNYSYLDLIVPSKWGLSINKKFEKDTLWELEYLKGSISAPWVAEHIGSASETRVSVIRRKFIWSGSFNIGFGASYNVLSARLGNDILDSVSDDAPSSNVIDARGFGTYFSVGNRWEFSKRGVVGIDWFVWTQPWFRLKEESDIIDELLDEEDREKAHDALSLIYKFPRITLLKLQLGFSF